MSDQIPPYVAGDLAYRMLLNLLAALGKQGTLPAETLDQIVDVGCTLLGSHPANAKRVDQLNSYRRAWGR